jgi:hypothetical protein
MPLVIVTRNPRVVTDEVAKILGPFLQEEVARVLNVPSDKNARLTSENVEVRFRDVGPLDVGSGTLGIDILAGDHPALHAKACTLALANRIRAAVSREGLKLPSRCFEDDSFVCVMLVPSGFAIL